MTPERDKVTLGLTPEAQEDLDRLMEMDAKWFDEQMDVFRLAVAVALGRGLDVSAEPLRGTDTKWNVGSLDRDGQLKALVEARVPGVTRPYEYSERLAVVGMRFLREGLVDAQQTLTAVVAGADDPAEEDAEETRGTES